MSWVRLRAVSFAQASSSASLGARTITRRPWAACVQSPRLPVSTGVAPDAPLLITDQRMPSSPCAGRLMSSVSIALFLARAALDHAHLFVSAAGEQAAHSNSSGADAGFGA